MPATNGNGQETKAVAAILKIVCAVLISCGGIGAIVAAIYSYGGLTRDVQNIERRLALQEQHIAEIDKMFIAMRKEYAEFREQYIQDATELKVNVKRLLTIAGQD